MIFQGHTNGGEGGGKDDSMYQSVAGHEGTCNVIYGIIPLKKVPLREKLNIYRSAVNFSGEDNK